MKRCDKCGHPLWDATPFDSVNHVIRGKNGEERHLSAGEWRVLETLAKRYPEYASTQELRRALFQNHYEHPLWADQQIKVRICRIRKALEITDWCIKTEYRYGYRIMARPLATDGAGADGAGGVTEKRLIAQCG